MSDMLDPFRLVVLKALTASLEGITVANGFQHNLTNAVFRGRMILTQDDPLPCLTVFEPPTAPDEVDPPEDTSARHNKHPLIVQGFAKDDRTHPTDPAYRLLADVQKRLSQERQRDSGYDILGLGPRLMGLHIGQGVVRSPDTVVSGDCFFWLPITLEYVEDLQNPFA